MRNSKQPLVILLLGLAGLPACGQNSSITAEIRLESQTVNEGEMFSVPTELRNTSNEEQVLSGQECGYGDLWTSDSSSIRVAASDCTKPGFMGLKLRPGEVFRWDVDLFPDLAPGPGESEWVTFRLGFKTSKVTIKPTPIKQILWSNAVTVKIIRASTPPRGRSASKTDKPADNNGTGGVTVTHVCEITHYDPSRKLPPAIMLTGTQVRVEKSDFAYSSKSGAFEGTVTVTNQSPGTIPGPFQVQFDSLTDGVTIAKANGDFGCWPYITIPNVTVLAPGESASINVQFSNPEEKTITFIPIVYSGILD